MTTADEPKYLGPEELAALLQPKAVPRDKRSHGKHVDRTTLMRWAQANIGLNPDEIVQTDIPTPAHESMLRFANDDPNRFWSMIAELDKREEQESDTRKTFRDDNRRLFRLMDAVLEERERLAKSAANE